MSFSGLKGVIRRRVLVNYRVDPEVMARQLPAPFRPRLQHGYAVAGVCLVRLEHLRPGWLPAWCGQASENAAHRVAVEWDEADGTTGSGVYVLRRDTNSWLNALAGGCMGFGRHGKAEFDVRDESSRLDISVRAPDGSMSVEVRALESSFFAGTPCFRRLPEASAFFRAGTVAYSPTGDPRRFEGVELCIGKWQALPLSVEHVRSGWFDDEARFPKGAAAFDHALLMRDVDHAWRRARQITWGGGIGARQPWRN